VKNGLARKHIFFKDGFQNGKGGLFGKNVLNEKYWILIKK